MKKKMMKKDMMNNNMDMKQLDGVAGGAGLRGAFNKSKMLAKRAANTTEGKRLIGQGKNLLNQHKGKLQKTLAAGLIKYGL